LEIENEGLELAAAEVDGGLLAKENGEFLLELFLLGQPVQVALLVKLEALGEGGTRGVHERLACHFSIAQLFEAKLIGFDSEFVENWSELPLRSGVSKQSLDPAFRKCSFWETQWADPDNRHGKR
jgi:hypothetical protein